MFSIVSHNRIPSLGPFPEDAALLAVSKTAPPMAVLRNARSFGSLGARSLRTRLIDDIDMIQTTGCTGS
jgi:hypothetical protein